MTKHEERVMCLTSFVYANLTWTEKPCGGGYKVDQLVAKLP